MKDASQALAAFAALSEPTRLEILRHLVRAAPNGSSAGDLARDLKVAPSRLSFHLAKLTQAELIEGRRQGKSIIYIARFDSLRGLIAFLLEDCCGGSERLNACCQTQAKPLP